MQQGQQLHHRLALDQLRCVVLQLPVHPRQWDMVAATCSELRDAVDGGRKVLRRAICIEHQQKHWSGHWAGELLVTLATNKMTADAIRLVVVGAPVDCWGGEENVTALIWAAARGDVELMDALIGVGAQLDLQCGEGCTALMVASDGGHTETAVALINGGAQLDLQDGEGHTALMMASRGGHTETTVALLNAGPDWTCRIMDATLRWTWLIREATSSGPRSCKRCDRTRAYEWSVTCEQRP